MGNARTVFKTFLDFGTVVAEVSPLLVLLCDASRMILVLPAESYIQASGCSIYESLGGERVVPHIDCWKC